MTNIIAQVPPVIEAMTGIELQDLTKNVPCLSQPPIEVMPVGNESNPAPVPQLAPEALEAVVDAPASKADEKKVDGK